MTSIGIPYSRIIEDERTFAIELKEDEPFVLYLKLTPTQTLSVINGAPVGLVIGSPVIQPNTISFRLNDVIGAPFWISRTFEPYKSTDYIDEVFSGLPRISEQLVQAPQAQVGLFDWNTRCIHTEFVSISKPKSPYASGPKNVWHHDRTKSQKTRN